VFIDDILVYLRTPEEHTHHLREVLGVIRRNELYANPYKCEFWLEKIAFIGHIVYKEGILVDPQKLETLMQWPRPKNLTKVRSFLGLAGYYSKLVRHFS